MPLPSQALSHSALPKRMDHGSGLVGEKTRGGLLPMKACAARDRGGLCCYTVNVSAAISYSILSKKLLLEIRRWVGFTEREDTQPTGINQRD